MKMFQSEANRWLFILLMFLPLFIMNFLGIGFFAMKKQYFASFFLVWNTVYLGFWFVLGCVIHAMINSKFSTINDFLIIMPSEGGEKKAILSGGVEYKKAKGGRPQEYTVCESKPNDIHVPTGLVFNGFATDRKIQLREIDIIHQISNKLYIRGYLEYDENTKTYHNQLDLSSLPAQMSLLALELKSTLKTKDGVERLYEKSEQKVYLERMASLEKEGVLTSLLVKTLEESNIATGKFSGTSTNLENRKVDQKVGSDKKIKAIIDEKLKEIKDSLLAQMSSSS